MEILKFSSFHGGNWQVSIKVMIIQQNKNKKVSGSGNVCRDFRSVLLASLPNCAGVFSKTILYSV